MSDDPNTRQAAIERAANLLQARLSWPQAEGCARDLAAAGLLADPTTPTRTTEQAVIDTVREMLADRRPTMAPMWRQRLKDALAAVDRHTATTQTDTGRQ